MSDIILLDDEQREHRLMLDQPRSIGRGAQCDLSVPTGRLDKLHARLFIEQGKVKVADEASTSGTYKNSEIVRAPTSLQAGDVLQIGNVRFSVVCITL